MNRHAPAHDRPFPRGLDLFTEAIRQVDDFFPTLVKLPS
jgi:hypothetical protein